MSVLICGGAGYIGSHVNKYLCQNGYDTVTFDNLSTGHQEAVKWGRFVQGDLRNQQEIDKLFEQYAIDSVVHLAACAYVAESVREPEKYYYNNVVCTLNLLGAMKRHGCRKLIFSSTCSTFGEPEQLPVTEDTPQNPVNPYGFTKFVLERAIKDYSRAYGLKFVVLRYFNAAGADPEGELGELHDPETHLIPLALEAAAGRRASINVYGTHYDTPDGSCIRDYIHVWDLASAHLLALRKLDEGGDSDFYNLGNERGTSVLEALDAVRRITGRTIPVLYEDRREGDPGILVGSSKKIRELLGWKPAYADIDVMVEHAWKWMQKNYRMS